VTPSVAWKAFLLQGIHLAIEASREQAGRGMYPEPIGEIVIGSQQSLVTFPLIKAEEGKFVVELTVAVHPPQTGRARGIPVERCFRSRGGAGSLPTRPGGIARRRPEWLPVAHQAERSLRRGSRAGCNQGVSGRSPRTPPRNSH